MSDDTKPVMGDRCETCGQVIAPTWETDPVEVGTLRTEVARLTAERDGAVDQWIMAEQENTRLTEELIEANLEIARHHRDFARWEEIADKGAKATAKLNAATKKNTEEPT